MFQELSVKDRRGSYICGQGLAPIAIAQGDPENLVSPKPPNEPVPRSDASLPLGASIGPKRTRGDEDCVLRQPAAALWQRLRVGQSSWFRTSSTVGNGAFFSKLKSLNVSSPSSFGFVAACAEKVLSSAIAFGRSAFSCDSAPVPNVSKSSRSAAAQVKLVHKSSCCMCPSLQSSMTRLALGLSSFCCD